MTSRRLSRGLRGAVLVGASVAAGAWLWLPRADQESITGGDPGAAVYVEHSGEALVPLPPAPLQSPEKVALGKSLFQDVRLSRDNTLSCAGCHDLATFGHDARRFSLGVGGKKGNVNAPSVFNSGLSFVQFWDGRAASLEEQVAGPLHNPVEMASDWENAVRKLEADDAFRSAFQHTYPNGITPENVADAIATFERSLLTEDAPFDRYLRGDQRAIDARAKEGYRRFRDFGCASCHQGANIGGNMFQRFGIMMDYFKDREPEIPFAKADLGRFNVTGREEDRYVFKVPSLRNVAETAPYFHDGSVARLEAAVAIMGRYQLGRELSTSEIDLLVSFLKTLTGKRPAGLDG
ncbi:MAG: cytochrome-c peroxidase [Gammaproteobacteria bacterium]|nr:cytochrome-c peroxidase [Gammaproteobacteria bacterium]MBU1415261.1 cytochrome-c peroxidase [Gammaproteobacteria bacterium]